MARCDICNSKIGISQKRYKIATNSKKLTICSNCQDEMKIVNEVNKQLQPLISELKEKINNEPDNAILYYELGKLLLYIEQLIVFIRFDKFCTIIFLFNLFRL